MTDKIVEVMARGMNREAIGKLVYDTWLKAADGPAWVSFEELAHVSPDDYTAVVAIVDALIAAFPTAALEALAREGFVVRPRKPTAAMVKVIKETKPFSWWCARCKVEVKQARCPHCGKSEREKT